MIEPRVSPNSRHMTCMIRWIRILIRLPSPVVRHSLQVKQLSVSPQGIPQISRIYQVQQLFINNLEAITTSTQFLGIILFLGIFLPSQICEEW